MNKTSRLKTLRDLAEDRERQSARRLGMIREGQREATDQLEKVSDYYDDYRTNEAGHVDAATSATALWNRRQFIGRLGNVVEQQRERLETLERDAERQTQAWTAARQSSDGLAKLEERWSREAAVREMRTERSAEDEFVQRMHHSKLKTTRR